MQITPWFKRQFLPILDNGQFPTIIERLAGTPLRLERKVLQFSDEFLVEFTDDDWSMQEHAGHLLNLESLWLHRFSDIMNGMPELTTADLTNQSTYDAKYNEQNIEVLVDTFAEVRGQLVGLLKTVQTEDLDKKSLHPRLKIPMKIIDLAYFVAEHDEGKRSVPKCTSCFLLVTN